MENLAAIAQTVAIISACFAIISGIGAWKREFIDKRQIELAEQLLATFFEIKDAIAFIRSPFASLEEGKSRQRKPYESKDESDLLDRGYIVVERYAKKENIFVSFNVMKYKFMATFGTETEDMFAETNKITNSIFSAANILATHYWQRQGRVQMEHDEFQKHLDEMHKYEGIFWDNWHEDDAIRFKLKQVQERFEAVTAPCFEEPMTTFKIFTAKWFK